jgi:lipoprotein-anchoring transpeptidase ErfK/SrfK
MRNGSGLLFVLLAGACVAAGAACGAPVARTARADAPESVATPAPAPAAADGGAPLTREEEELNLRPLKLPLAGPRIVVEKGARRLRLYASGELVRVRRVGLGTAPEGDKVRAGDRRTPHGSFYVCVKNARSAFYLSLGLSYPNEEDAERGLRDGLITRAQHRKIVHAIKRKQTPPWDTALGGEIFIHGNGSQTDWTWGCVALEDGDIKELFDAVPLGTEVRIEP